MSDDYLQSTFNTGKTWKAPENCNHGWDGTKYWLTPKGACVKCGAKNVEAFAYLGIDTAKGPDRSVITCSKCHVEWKNHAHPVCKKP